MHTTPVGRIAGFGRVRVVALLTALLAAGACAAAPAAVEVPPGAGGSPESPAEGSSFLTTEFPFVWAGPVTRTSTWGGSMLVVPPPAGVTPTVSVVGIFERCRSGGPLCALPGRASTVSLGVITSIGSGTAAEDGTLIPGVQDKLAYQLVWRGVPCLPAGPQVPGPPVVESCTEVAFVDAVSGDDLGQIGGPGLTED